MGHAWKRKRLLASTDARALKAARNLTKLMKLQPSSILQILAARGLIESSAETLLLVRLGGADMQTPPQA